MKTYEIINKNNITVYYNVTEKELANLAKKIARYGWTVKEVKKYNNNNGTFREAENWNEGINRENWAI